jgi:hypothetical protein
MRPRLAPAPIGLSSENAAHRIAVEWETEDGEMKEGLFIPRRDTGSMLNGLTGGRLFPGEHHRARFRVEEDSSGIDLNLQSQDGAVSVRVCGRFGCEFPDGSCFSSLADASDFFEGGAIGYSVTSKGRQLDGLKLVTDEWRVEPIQLDHVESSHFSDPARFPPGSAEFDCALIMRSVAHEWHAVEDIHIPVPQY